MKLIVWNCQGIRGDLIVDNLLEQNRLHTPDIVILLETKNKSSRYGYLTKKLEMEFMHTVEPKGIGGGLCLFWRDASQILLVKHFDFMIEVKVWDEEKMYHWRLFGIYASTDEKMRRDQWRALGNRIVKESDICLLIGDFNDILCNGEKEGGKLKSVTSMRDFREFIANNELVDLGYEGYPFTWRNKRDSLPIQQRLDRGLASTGWFNLYPDTKIIHVVLEGSDHSLLLLTTKKSEEWRGNRFMYDARWSNQKECRNIVTKDWGWEGRGFHAFRFYEKLKLVRMSLKGWYRKKGRNSKKTIDKLKRELRKAYQSNNFASAESSKPSQFEEITGCVQAKILHEDNLMLIAPVSNSEIQVAAFQIPHTRASGPDGFSGSFYQDHWEVVGNDVTKTIKAFWHSGKLLKKLNHTNLVLIPKVSCPKSLLQYRPIALCNVCYKILAKTEEDRSGMALKLDMAKAYDRVEWEFLLVMMAKLGFDPMFCKRIKECVSTASYSILVNGAPTGYILPQRGLRQGDPLSLFLFLLCTERFSALIRNVLFCEVTVEDEKGVREILNSYVAGSGQEINMTKSSIFYGAKVKKREKKLIENTLNIQSRMGFGKYLGLQADFGVSKKAVFVDVRERIDVKMVGWAEQFLSQAGNEVLIKVVAMAMPNHAMSCFKLPIDVCKDIEKAIRSYWWRGSMNRKGVQWVSWDRLQKEKGLLWRVGDGASISIRNDPWYPVPSTFQVRPKENLNATLVCDLIDPTTRTWKVDIIEDGFTHKETDVILSIPISRTGSTDRLRWFHTACGTYSVKRDTGLLWSLWKMVHSVRKGRGLNSEKTKHNLLWKSIWCLDVPSKLRFFIWKCCNHALVVRRNLKRQHMRVDNVCGVCGQFDETENHLFFRCETSHRFWFCSPLQLNSIELEGVDFLQSWASFCNRVDQLDNRMELLQEFVFGLWRLWKNRNDIIFNHKNHEPAEILMDWRRSLAEYRNAAEKREQSMKPVLTKVAHDGAGQKHWHKPGFGTIKINTDAAWSKVTQQAGLGWVACDFAGVLQGAGGSGSIRFHSAAAAEVAAIREALEDCLLRGFRNVIIESDAKTIVQMIRNELTQDFRLECLLGDIEFLARRMQAVVFIFVSRESNKAAHLVTKYVGEKGRDFVWDCIGPEFLFNTLAQDINLPLRI
ncbi:uncharacterized protein [Malus domestica]|uniref:uncharacterized protein n=1 Tax=Malus domestica TaxID=3750 RepID=UPI00397499D1